MCYMLERLTFERLSTYIIYELNLLQPAQPDENLHDGHVEVSLEQHAPGGPAETHIRTETAAASPSASAPRTPARPWAWRARRHAWS